MVSVILEEEASLAVQYIMSSICSELSFWQSIIGTKRPGFRWTFSPEKDVQHYEPFWHDTIIP